MPVDLDATLYQRHDRVTVLADGFGVKTRHDAHLTLDENGIVQATKFGLEYTGPSDREKTKTEQEKFSDEPFFKTQDCTLRVYTAHTEKGETHYIPTTLGERFKLDEHWGVYDEETNYIYEIWSDELSDTQMLVSIGKETSQKITPSEVEERISSGRYTPVMEIGQ